MTSAGLTYCDRCGKSSGASDVDHTPCAVARLREPPRYCVSCGRRLVVQVFPRGWRARCVEHGEIASP